MVTSISWQNAERTMSGHDESVEALSYLCDCGERQTMCHLMACVDAPSCTWTALAMPTLAGVNCAKHWEESIKQYLTTEDSKKNIMATRPYQ